jgi:hypothetical protein
MIVVNVLYAMIRVPVSIWTITASATSRWCVSCSSRWGCGA